MFSKLYATIFSTLDDFKHDQRGVTAIEYAIIGVVISAMVLAVFVTDNQLATALSNAMQTIGSNIAAAEDAASS
ncbi:Flp family type IVb pilin [Vibrio atypicus]|uniref:Flp family type IVb pilin n=1 Tax=Vibrio atypicus TaxID=558271 RepID=UPI001356B8CA|nr:Flp family type IVb pilin [Vibrio atypicus]